MEKRKKKKKGEKEEEIIGYGKNKNSYNGD